MCKFIETIGRIQIHIIFVLKCILPYDERIYLLAVINSVLNFDALRTNIELELEFRLHGQVDFRLFQLWTTMFTNCHIM